jgi:Interferon-induced transmembrane protein
VQSAGQDFFSPEPEVVSGYVDAENRTKGEVVKQRLWMAIVTVVMFWPLGIAAVMYSNRVPQKLAEGDIAGAIHDSTWVKRMFFIALGVGGLLFLLVIIAAAAGGGSTTTTTGY